MVEVIVAGIVFVLAITGIILLPVIRRALILGKTRVLTGTPVSFFPESHIDEERLKTAVLLAIVALRPLWGDQVEEKLKGVVVRVMDADSWSSAGGMKVAGQRVTLNGIVTVIVNRKLESMAHEFAHVLERALTGDTDTTHESWKTNGIYTAIGNYEAALAKV